MRTNERPDRDGQDARAAAIDDTAGTQPAKATRHDQSYRKGWSDVHHSTRRRRERARERWPAYAAGYEHGRIDGASHPFCPDWDDAHRVGGELPDHCPWNPATAKVTPDWEPITGEVTAATIRRRADALADRKRPPLRPPTSTANAQEVRHAVDR
jgi:hypothetical protein